jgi:hypothetical protein
MDEPPELDRLTILPNGMSAEDWEKAERRRVAAHRGIRGCLVMAAALAAFIWFLNF